MREKNCLTAYMVLKVFPAISIMMISVYSDERDVTYWLNPNILQTTSASSLPKLSSQTVFHFLFKYISSGPAFEVLPDKRTVSSA